MEQTKHITHNVWDLIQHCSSREQAEDIVSNYLLEHCSFALLIQELAINQGLSQQQVSKYLKDNDIEVEPIIHLPHWVFGNVAESRNNRIVCINMAQLLLEERSKQQ